MPPLARKILLAITSSISLGIVAWGIYTHHTARIVIGIGLLVYYGMYYYFARPHK